MPTDCEELKKVVSRLLAAAEKADEIFAGHNDNASFKLIDLKANYAGMAGEIEKLRELLGE